MQIFITVVLAEKKIMDDLTDTDRGIQIIRAYLSFGEIGLLAPGEYLWWVY